jgi:phytoene synthase
VDARAPAETAVQPSGEASRASVREAVRAHDIDRYLSALLAREPARSDLMTLYAFAAEIVRIPNLVSDPLLGEIRLQWWRDALSRSCGNGEAAAARTGAPLADALADVARRHRLPPGLLIGMADARSFDLAREPMPDAQALRAFLAKTEGALFNLAARVLGAQESAALERASEAAGDAVGLVRVLCSIARDRARGLCRIPRTLLEDEEASPTDLLAGEQAEAVAHVVARMATRALARHEEAARAVAGLAPAVLPAFLPLVMVPRYLDRLAAPGHRPLVREVEINPFTRVWRLWLARLRGRIA